MGQTEREILERALHAVAEQATVAASAIIDETLDAGLDGSRAVTLQARFAAP